MSLASAGSEQRRDYNGRMDRDPWFTTSSHTLPAGQLITKPGVRGHPDLPPGSSVLQRVPLAGDGHFLDASGTAGLGALLAAGSGVSQLSVLSDSAAELNCAARTHADRPTAVQAGLLAGELAAAPDTVLLLPAADRGNARAELEVKAAAAALAPGGRLILVGHKDQGGRRFEGFAGPLFRQAEVIRRDGGWRVLDCRGPLTDQPLPPATLGFEAAGLELTALKGTFAAGKLDPGTAQLLAVFPGGDWLAGQQVLDLGCGYGLLALTAALAGATVTAVDDDLAAVRSTALNAERHGLAERLQALHSDLDSALAPAVSFDTVVMNPPFHVGRGVRLDLSRAFVTAAGRRLKAGGELWLVANRALPYEQMFAGWRSVSEVRAEGGFKVLRAVR